MRAPASSGTACKAPLPPRAGSRSRKAATATIERSPLALEVVTGPCAGSVFSKNTVLIRVGRTTKSNFHIQDLEVSSKHAEIRWEAPAEGGENIASASNGGDPVAGWVVVDVGSSNGTRLERGNEPEIAVGDEPVLLRHNDVLWFGCASSVRVRLGDSGHSFATNHNDSSSNNAACTQASDSTTTTAVVANETRASSKRPAATPARTMAASNKRSSAATAASNPAPPATAADAPAPMDTCDGTKAAPMPAHASDALIPDSSGSVSSPAHPATLPSEVPGGNVNLASAGTAASTTTSAGLPTAAATLTTAVAATAAAAEAPSIPTASAGAASRPVAASQSAAVTTGTATVEPTATAHQGNPLDVVAETGPAAMSAGVTSLPNASSLPAVLLPHAVTERAVAPPQDSASLTVEQALKREMQSCLDRLQAHAEEMVRALQQEAAMGRAEILALAESVGCK
eukprot:jgi/Mesvir1/24521/Mv21863-RA.1